MFLAYTQVWKNAELIRPEEGKTVLGFNRCDGYHIVVWGDGEYREDSPLSRSVAINYWTELPNHEELFQSLRDGSMVPFRVYQQTP